MATMNFKYIEDAVSSLGNYVSQTALTDCVTTTASTGDGLIGWQGYYNANQWGIGGAIGSGGLQSQLQMRALQSIDIQKPKKTFSRVLDALRSEIKEWCGDALVMA